MKNKIIYNVCLGRSGSTLLSLLLPKYLDIKSVGEINNLGHVFVDPHKDHKCGCTTPIKECDFWNDILKSLDIKSHFDLYENMKISNPEYLNFNDRLFDVLFEKQNISYLFDKSMQENRLNKLVKSKKHEIIIIHLIRDGRAVANSWQKYSKRKDRGLIYLRLFSAAIKWTYVNLKIHLKYSKKSNYHLIKYEDLTLNPEKELLKIEKKFSLEKSKKQNSVDTHFVGGNRMRKQFNGFKDVKYDDSYKNEVKTIDWFLVSLIQFIPLKLFGYSIKR